MSGVTLGTVALAGLATAAVVGTGYQIYAGEKSASAQKGAMADAKASALKQEKLAEEGINAANKKSPNTNAILAAAQQAGKTGGASTMLTGPTGVDPSSLSLGKSSLLGS